MQTALVAWRWATGSGYACWVCPVYAASCFLEKASFLGSGMSNLQGRQQIQTVEGCSRINMVRRASQFVSIALSIIVVALPLLACLTSFAEMSPEQRECCEKMAGRCEMSVMPSSHSCCQHPVSPHTATASRIQSSDFGLAITMLSRGFPLL